MATRALGGLSGRSPSLFPVIIDSVGDSDEEVRMDMMGDSAESRLLTGRRKLLNERNLAHRRARDHRRALQQIHPERDFSLRLRRPFESTEDSNCTVGTQQKAERAANSQRPGATARTRRVSPPDRAWADSGRVTGMTVWHIATRSLILPACDDSLEKPRRSVRAEWHDCLRLHRTPPLDRSAASRKRTSSAGISATGATAHSARPTYPS